MLFWTLCHSKNRTAAGIFQLETVQINKTRASEAGGWLQYPGFSGSEELSDTVLNKLYDYYMTCACDWR